MPMKNPPHPGHLIKTEIIDVYDLNVTTGAKVLGVQRRALSKVLSGQTSLSAEMAIRIEKAFGVSMETLMRMQLAHDISQVRKRAKKIKVRRYRTGAP